MSKVSIIVPVYNVDQYLEECIDSIVNQSYRNIELIIVDDGSTDNCAEIMDSYANKDERIIVIHKQNGGLVSARKAGISVASGDYIFNVDGDDSIVTDCIQKLVDIVECEKADIVTSAAYDGINILKDSLPTGVYNNDERLKILWSNMLAANGFYSFGILPFIWGKLFKKDILYRHQMMVDERISVGEDVACTYSALLDAKCVVVTHMVNYMYRRREDSLTVKDINKVDETFEHLSMRYRYLRDNLLKKGKMREELTYQINKYFYWALLSKYPEYLFTSDGDSFIPFNVNKDEKLILFGAGQFGRKIHELLISRGFKNVLYTTETDAYNKEGIKCAVELIDSDYDKVLIATIRKEFSYEMKLVLENIGVSACKIQDIIQSKDIISVIESIL